MQQSYRPLTPENRGTAGKTGRRRRKSGGPLLILLALLVAATAALLGIREMKARWLHAEIEPFEKVFAPNISVDGLSISGLTPQEAFDLLYENAVERLNSWSLALTYGGHSYITLTYQLLGMQVPVEQFKSFLNEAWALTHTGDVLQRKQALDRRDQEPYVASSAESALDVQQLDTILRSIAQNIHLTAVDATLLQFVPDAREPFVFQDERYGLSLDVERARSEILSLAAMASGGMYELVPDIVPPQLTRAQLEKNVSLLSTVSTPIDKGSTENRNNNIRVSFSRINGLVLKPGETFSFNGVVGPRTYKNGFFDALEYAYGDLVTGVGGGVCQASTTLYQAVLRAKLKVTDRTPHSDPVNYTSKGLDATVYYSSGRKIDFKFKNSSDGNIYLTAHVVADSNNASRLACLISIYGQSLGDGVDYRLSSQVVETLKPSSEFIYKVDATGEHVIFSDETKLYAKAKDGYVVQSFLQRHENGTLVSETLVSVDTYPSRQAVYWKGKTTRKTDKP